MIRWQDQIGKALNTIGIGKMEPLGLAQFKRTKIRVGVEYGPFLAGIGVDRDEPSWTDRALARTDQFFLCKVTTDQHVIGHHDAPGLRFSDAPSQQRHLTARPPGLLPRIKRPAIR